MIDERLVKTTQHLDTIRYTIPLTPASDYIDLNIREVATVSFDSIAISTGVKLPINVTGSLYEIIVKCDTTAANLDVSINPNDTLITWNRTWLGYNPSDTTVYTIGYNNSGLRSCVDPQWGTSDTGPQYIRFLAQTTVTKKFVLTYVFDNLGISISSSFWDDTTTIWSQLGTIYWPVPTDTTALISGTVMITRLL